MEYFVDLITSAVDNNVADELVTVLTYFYFSWQAEVMGSKKQNIKDISSDGEMVAYKMMFGPSTDWTCHAKIGKH